MSQEQKPTIDERLAAAEAVCVLYGWTPMRGESDRELATYELWKKWVDIVGSKFLILKAHPELNDERVAELAQQRRTTLRTTRKQISLPADLGQP